MGGICRRIQTFILHQSFLKRMTTKIMELIDNIKKKIDDKNYLEICNELKKLNIEKNKYQIKYYKILFQNNLQDAKMYAKIKNKIVYIKNDDVLSYLKEYKDIKSDKNYLFTFKKIEGKTYLEVYYHITYEDENNDREINSIYYNKILILDYKKL